MPDSLDEEDASCIERFVFELVALEFVELLGSASITLAAPGALDEKTCFGATGSIAAILVALPTVFLNRPAATTVVAALLNRED